MVIFQKKRKTFLTIFNILRLYAGIVCLFICSFMYIATLFGQ